MVILRENGVEIDIWVNISHQVWSSIRSPAPVLCGRCDLGGARTGATTIAEAS